MRRILPKSLAGLGGAAPPAPPDPGAQVPIPVRPIDPAILVDLAIEVWRLHGKLRRARIPDESRVSLRRSVDRLTEGLADIGIKIQDPQGEQFREGMIWEIATLEAPGEVVRETLRPAVYLSGQLVRLAQVIIGPAAAGGAGAHEAGSGEGDNVEKSDR
jgi:hypothetical protein